MRPAVPSEVNAGIMYQRQWKPRIKCLRSILPGLCFGLLTLVMPIEGVAEKKWTAARCKAVLEEARSNLKQPIPVGLFRKLYVLCQRHPERSQARYQAYLKKRQR